MGCRGKWEYSGMRFVGVRGGLCVVVVERGGGGVGVWEERGVCVCAVFAIMDLVWRFFVTHFCVVV